MSDITVEHLLSLVDLVINNYNL